MSDRKTELEIKKARLEQMRLSRIKNAAAAISHLATSAASTNSSGDSNSNKDVDPDKILIECGITTPVLTSSSNTNQTAALTQHLHDEPLHHQQISSSRLLAIHKTRKPVKLSVNVVNSIEIAPRELVTYSKETQTPENEANTEKNSKPDYYVLTYDKDEDDETSIEVSSLNNLKGTQTIKQNDNSKIQDGSKDANEDKVKIKEINDEERVKLIQNEEFLRFFSLKTRILEKALDQDDIFFDYGGVDKNKEIIETGESLKLNREFYDERWKNRIVTCLDWSPHFPELLLASYEDSSLDPDGVALVWNTKFKTSVPEYIFNCSSWVTSCCFAKFHPNLIIGGTYSGQIVMWDNRSNKRTPIQRSSLSAASHTHPVYCVQVVGSQNAHNLISISNDGRLCSWTLDNMNTPQETLDLQCKQSKNVAITTMAFRPGDVNNFIVGCEEGPVYTSTRHGNKSGINETFEGHYGPVTGLSCNQVPGPIDFSNIFLTTSFDWSVKLWNIKEPGKPIYSFENNSDYVYDVNWSPIHPALFATVDGTGRLDLWNLINDSEVPTSTIYLDGQPALNKIRWSQNGLQIAVGDDQGKISLFDVNENYAQPRADDWTKFVRVLQDLKQNTSELDENLAANSGGGGGATTNSGGGVASSGNSILSPITQTSNTSQSQLNLTPINNSLKSNPSDTNLYGLSISNNNTNNAPLISPSSSATMLAQLKSPLTPKPN